jgi:hypothetical protein
LHFSAGGRSAAAGLGADGEPSVTLGMPAEMELKV